MPLVSRTRATLRSAEFGFFGVWVKTRTQTPRFCGLFCSAGLFVFVTIFLRPARTSWLIVGIVLREQKKSEARGLESDCRLQTSNIVCFEPERRSVAPENPSKSRRIGRSGYLPGRYSYSGEAR